MIVLSVLSTAACLLPNNKRVSSSTFALKCSLPLLCKGSYLLSLEPCKEDCKVQKGGRNILFPNTKLIFDAGLRPDLT